MANTKLKSKIFRPIGGGLGKALLIEDFVKHDVGTLAQALFTDSKYAQKLKEGALKNGAYAYMGVDYSTHFTTSTCFNESDIDCSTNDFASEGIYFLYTDQLYVVIDPKCCGNSRIITQNISQSTTNQPLIFAWDGTGDKVVLTESIFESLIKPSLNVSIDKGDMSIDGDKPSLLSIFDEIILKGVHMPDCNVGINLGTTKVIILDDFVKRFLHGQSNVFTVWNDDDDGNYIRHNTVLLGLGFDSKNIDSNKDLFFGTSAASEGDPYSFTISGRSIFPEHMLAHETYFEKDPSLFAPKDMDTEPTLWEQISSACTYEYAYANLEQVSPFDTKYLERLYGNHTVAYRDVGTGILFPSVCACQATMLSLIGRMSLVEKKLFDALGDEGKRAYLSVRLSISGMRPYIDKVSETYLTLAIETVNFNVGTSDKMYLQQKGFDPSGKGFVYQSFSMNSHNPHKSELRFIERNVFLTCQEKVK